MLNEPLSLFRTRNPLRSLAEDFARMLQLACEMTVTAGDIFFQQTTSPAERTRIYKKDLQVNKLERSIRKRVVAHLSVGSNRVDIPYCLLLMSLVKDVERLGDYAKNLSEAADLSPGDLPDDEIVGELREIRSGVEEAFREAHEVFASSDHERALTLIRQEKDHAQRADQLLKRIAQSDYGSASAVALALGARYYKRIGGHLLNVLSSVVMPLHKIDYYDEDELVASER